MTERFEVAPDHLGRTEQEWAASPVVDLPALEVPVAHHAVVLAPHPDDEVLGAGGLVQVLAGAGVPIDVCAVTDGEACWGPVDTATADELRRTRTAESEEALRRLGATVTRHRLGLPDGGVAGYAQVVRDWLADHLTLDTLCIAPWTSDGHPDHDAVGRAALQMAISVGAPCLRYLVWAWHWADPTGDDLPWLACRRLDLTDGQVGAKHRAIEAFTSQTCVPLESQGGLSVLPPSVLARFWRPYEVYVT